MWYTPVTIPGQNNPESNAISAKVAAEGVSMLVPAATAKAGKYINTTIDTQRKLKEFANLYNQRKYDVGDLRKQFRKSFESNGLNADDFILAGDNITKDQLIRPASYKDGMYVRTNRNPLVLDPSKRLDVPGGRHWAAPGAAPKHGVSTGDQILLDGTYIQKYKNGNPVITADTELADVVEKHILPEYAELEAKLNLRGKTLFNPSRFNSYVSGDPGLRKAVAQVQGFGVGTAKQQLTRGVPSRLGYEVVRDVPDYAVNPTSDVRGFVPYQSTFHWVPKGGESALTIPPNLRTVTLQPPEADMFNRILAGLRRIYYGPNKREIAIPTKR